MTAPQKEPAGSEREAFEAWASIEWDGKSVPDAAWLGWQARASLASPSSGGWMPITESNDYKRAFVVGKTYLTQAGKAVTIIAENTRIGPYYTCVQGDDGETPDKGWRYDRKSDAGRCTGSAFDMSDPRNLVVGSEQPEIESSGDKSHE